MVPKVTEGRDRCPVQEGASFCEGRDAHGRLAAKQMLTYASVWATQVGGGGAQRRARASLGDCQLMPHAVTSTQCHELHQDP